MTTMEANIPCARCHKSFTVPLGELRPGNRRACPHCGASITFSGQDASKVQQAVEQMTHQVGNAAVQVTVTTKPSRPWWQFWGR